MIITLGLITFHFVGLVVMCLRDPAGLVERKHGPR